MTTSIKRQRTEQVDKIDDQSDHSQDSNSSQSDGYSDDNREQILQSDIEGNEQKSQSEIESDDNLLNEKLNQFQNNDRQQQMRTQNSASLDTVKKNPSFSSAIQRLLEKETSAKPILSKNTIEKRIDDKKLEAAAKKVIKNTVVKVSARQVPVTSDFDRQMRKIATRGGTIVV